MQLPSALGTLQYYNCWLYFAGQAISLVGNWMQRIAVSWLVYDITHSAFMAITFSKSHVLCTYVTPAAVL